MFLIQIKTRLISEKSGILNCFIYWIPRIQNVEYNGLKSYYFVNTKDVVSCMYFINGIINFPYIGQINYTLKYFTQVLFVLVIIQRQIKKKTICKMYFYN